ncbi:MAG TPA: hypothetical protein ENJ08_14270 [Gammaproteobacteria bacterium]|nr:hypothetical protein [Gammaproteobacteria bacterium]
MQLDKIIIALRERNSWEAMDLGVKLMGVLWPVILFPWLIIFSITLSLAVFVQYLSHSYLALVLMWWTKPIYESMLLYILSRSVFGEYPTTSDVYSSAGSWLKTGLRTWLFFWRFSPSRSFNMPVHLLEGLKGHGRSKRLLSLHRVTSLNSASVTIVGLLFEVVLAGTLLLSIFYIYPDVVGDYFRSGTGNSLAQQAADEFSWFILLTVVYGLTLFVLEPFYVAAGFMLYLNRRTQLEGWDIELDFRKLVQRIEQQNSGHNAMHDSVIKSEGHG